MQKNYFILSNNLSLDQKDPEVEKLLINEMNTSENRIILYLCMKNLVQITIEQIKMSDKNSYMIDFIKFTRHNYEFILKYVIRLCEIGHKDNNLSVQIIQHSVKILEEIVNVDKTEFLVLNTQHVYACVKNMARIFLLPLNTQMYLNKFLNLIPSKLFGFYQEIKGNFSKIYYLKLLAVLTKFDCSLLSEQILDGFKEFDIILCYEITEPIETKCYSIGNHQQLIMISLFRLLSSLLNFYLKQDLLKNANYLLGYLNCRYGWNFPSNFQLFP
ncbi:hypothetical protein HZS_2308 [Henneguya salminicola]|nr:hypothetical protein HZS_2308 [Henneguya salminicola]